jgi:hypothetical protein
MMGTKITQSKFEALEAGTYRARLSAAVMEHSEYSDSGEQVAMRFDLLEPGLEDRSVRAWANPKLTGGKKPSKLYTWCSIILFGGKPLPDDFELDLDDLLDREVRVVVEVKPDTGYNRILQLLPVRRPVPPLSHRPDASTRATTSAQAPASSPQVPAEPEFPPMDWDALADPGPTNEDEE